MSYSFEDLLEQGSQEAVKETKSAGGGFPEELRGIYDNFPEGTVISGICLEAKWFGYDGENNIVALQWEITAPTELKGKRVYHNMKVYDNERQGRQLLAVYYQALKKPYPYGREKPSDSKLREDLYMKKINLEIKEYELEDKPENYDAKTGMLKTGNWYDAVTEYNEQETKIGKLKYPRLQPLLEQYRAKQKQDGTPQQAPQNNMADFDSFDDSIPF